MRYLVTSKMGRHRRSFHIDAVNAESAKADALCLARFYANSSTGYTAQTWRFGTLSISCGEDAPATLLRTERPQLRLIT
jgi:hypothetical protein